MWHNQEKADCIGDNGQKQHIDINLLRDLYHIEFHEVKYIEHAKRVYRTNGVCISNERQRVYRILRSKIYRAREASLRFPVDINLFEIFDIS